MPTPKPSASNAAKTIKANVAKSKAEISKGFKDEFITLQRDVKNSLFGWVSRFQKFRDIVKNNYELGRMHLGLGNMKDAQLRFKFVLWLDPLHVDATYYLGVVYLSKGDKKQAADYFRRALKMRPSFEEAKYLLSVAAGKPVSGDSMPTRMPLTLATELFDGLAYDYTQQQIGMMKYEGHTQLDNTLRSCIVPGRIDHVILELGCGTGLCGPGVRDFASHLTGIDLSQKMLEEAVLLQDNNDKKIYDALIKREAVEFLKDSQNSSYDVVMSAGMFSYIGDLEAVFTESARVLKGGGFFAFTADHMEGEGYRFVPAEARFSYSKPYLEALAANCGLKELRVKDHPVYANYPAWICVFQK